MSPYNFTIILFSLFNLGMCLRCHVGSETSNITYLYQEECPGVIDMCVYHQYTNDRGEYYVG